MSRRSTALVLVLVVIGASWGAVPAPAAEAPADTHVVLLHEVLVRGTRPVATAGGAGAITTTLDSLGLGPHPTAEQVLRAMPTVYVRTNSRGEAEVTVRGSESRQVAVLVDGVPLSYGWDGRADVSVIPLLAVQQVTLVRGLSSLVHGTNTLGGVVEFDTRAADPSSQARAIVLHGGVDQPVGGSFSGMIAVPRDLGWGVLSVRGGAGYRDSPGQTLARGVVEPMLGAEMRANTDIRQRNGFLSMRVDGDQGAYAALTGAGYEAERGIAAQLGVTDARFWRYPEMNRRLGILAAGTGRHDMPWGGRAGLELSGGLDRGSTEIDAYDSRTYDTIVAEEDGEDDIRTLRGVASQTLGGRGELKLAGSLGDIRHDEILDGVLQPYQQRLSSIAAQTLFALPGRGLATQFDVTAGVAHDRARTPVTGNKPSFGELDRWGGRIGVTAHFAGATSAHASVSQRARFPSLRELYSGALGSFEPNPHLKPENLLAVEAGFTKRTERGTAQVVAFYHDLSDAVVRIRPPGQNFQRVNQEGIRSVGVELLASHALGRIELSGDLIVQDVEVLDPAAGLARPENMPAVMGGVKAQMAAVSRVFVAAEARYTGSQFVIDPEAGIDSELPDAGRLNLELFRRWSIGGAGWISGAEVRVACTNVTDTPQYDAFGLPQPGRSIRAELRVH